MLKKGKVGRCTWDVGRRTLVLVILFMLVAANLFFFITSSRAQRYDYEEEELEDRREERQIREMNEMAFSIMFWILLGGSSTYVVARGLRR